jgi:hypothetical protein
VVSLRSDSSRGGAATAGHGHQHSGRRQAPSPPNRRELAHCTGDLRGALLVFYEGCWDDDLNPVVFSRVTRASYGIEKIMLDQNCDIIRRRRYGQGIAQPGGPPGWVGPLGRSARFRLRVATLASGSIPALANDRLRERRCRCSCRFQENAGCP